MKIIRMTKTASGPIGTFPTGMVRTVDDVTAAMLIGAEAAELVGNIAQPRPEGPRDPVSRETASSPEGPHSAADSVPELVEGEEAEAAALEGAPEVAVVGVPRKRVKKA